MADAVYVPVLLAIKFSSYSTLLFN